MSACSENSPASENKQCANNPTSASQETDWTVKIQNKRLHLRTAWARRRSASRRRAAAALCKRSPARQRAAERRAEHSTTTRVSSRWESLEKVLSKCLVTLVSVVKKKISHKTKPNTPSLLPSGVFKARDSRWDLVVFCLPRLWLLLPLPWLFPNLPRALTLAPTLPLRVSRFPSLQSGTDSNGAAHPLGAGQGSAQMNSRLLHRPVSERQKEEALTSGHS